MKKRTKIILSIILVSIVLLALWNKFFNGVKFNDTYVNGNTSGNLYNAGLFCESEGKIFFANPNDKGKLYSMDISGQNIKKLCNDTAMYINADSHYIYYVRNNNENDYDYDFFSYNNNSLCRISRNGGKVTILDPDPCIYSSLIGNYIYYLHYDEKTATTLYKVKIDGTEKQQLSDSYLFTCNTSGKYFYYNNPSNGKLYRYNTEKDVGVEFFDCNCYKPIVLNDSNAYYIDVSSNHAIAHTNVNNPNPKIITEGNVEIYNVYGSYIYYQRGGKDPALCMVKNDGTEFKEIAKGEYCNICVTSYNIYFKDFYTNVTYYTPTANPGIVNIFSPEEE